MSDGKIVIKFVLFAKMPAGKIYEVGSCFKIIGKNYCEVLKYTNLVRIIVQF